MPFLFSPGAEAVASRRLRALYGDVPPTDLHAELNLAGTLLRAQLPTLPEYAALSPEDRTFFDMAVGLRAAMNLLAPAVLAAHDGLAKLKTPDYEYTFTVPDLAERERWAEEVAQAVGQLVRLVRAAEGKPRRPFSMFGAAGVARQRSRCRLSGAGIVRLIVPDGWVYNDWFETGACAFLTGPEVISL